MSDASQTRTDSLTPPPNGRSSDVEALTAALAEARLKQTLLEQAIAQVPVGVLVVDTKTGLPQMVNQAGIDFLGRGLDPQRPKDASAEIYPNYLPGTQQLYPVQDLPMVRTMSTGEPAHAELDIQRPEGRVRVGMTTTPVRDAMGRMVSAVAVIQPVTHQPVAAASSQELEEARGFLETVIEALPVGLFMKDSKDLRFVRWNKANEDLIGLQREVVLGKNDADFFPPEEAEWFIQNDREVMASGQLLDIPEETVQTTHRGERIFHTRKVPILGADGQPRYLLGISEDITERRRAEATLAQRAAELQDATAFLDSVIENLPTMLFVKEAQDLRFVRWNKTGEDLLGFSREAMVGKNDYDFFPKDEADFFTSKDREVLAGKQLVDIPEESIQTAHRGRRLLHTRKIPIMDALGQPKYLLGISEDITERKQAEQDLREREEDLTALLEFSPEAIGVVNTQTGLFENVNSAAERLYGLPRDELVKVGPAHMSPEFQPDGRPSLEAAMEKIGAALQGGRPVFEWTHRNAAGTLIPCEIRLVGLAAPRQHLVRFSATDITERKNAEARLLRSQEQYTLAVEGSNDGIWDWDIRTNQVYYSPRWKEIVGYAETELTNGFADFEGLLHPDDHDRVLSVLDEYLTGKRETYDVEFRSRHKDGSYRWIRERGKAVWDATGAPYRMAGSNSDITDQKQAAAASSKRAAELEVVAQVGTAAATILDPNHLLQTVVDLTKSNFQLYHAHVYLLNDAGDTLELAAGAGEVGHTMVGQGWHIPINREQSLVARAARTRQGVIVNDVRVAPDFLPNPLLPDTRSEMALPIIASERVLGVLDVQADEANHFTNEDLRIQNILVTQIAVALQNARQFAEARRLADRETLVNSISQQIQNATTVESAMQIAARELGRALGAQRTVVQLGQPDKSPR